MIRIIFIIVVIFSLNYGQTDYSPNYWQDTVKVTAIRHRAARDVSQTSRIITREEIERAGAISLSELIASKFGIHFIQEGIWGARDTESSTGAKIRHRGKEMKVMIDGHPASMSLFNCIINNELTSDFVEAVEVSYGTESVIYGSDGLGGVINLITRSVSGDEFTIKVLGGSEGSRLIDFFSGIDTKKADMIVSGQGKKTDGNLTHSALEDYNIFGKMVYQINKEWKGEISGKYYYGDWERPEIMNVLPSTQKVYRNNSTFDFTRAGQNTFFQFRIHHLYGYHHFQLNDGWRSEDQSYGVNITETIRQKDLVFTFGADYRRYGAHHISGDSLYNTVFKWVKDTSWVYGDERALFALISYSWDKLDFSFGNRYHYFEHFGSQVAPKVGLKYYFSETIYARMGFNRGFRQPNLIQSSFHKFAFNVQLRPEIADQTEISFGYSKNKFSYEVIFYYLDGKHKVELVEIDNKKQFVNTEHYIHRGIDLYLSTPHYSHFRYELNFSYLNSGHNTMYNPEYKITQSIHFNKTKFDGSISYLAAMNQYASNNSKNKLKDYHTFDGKLSYRVIENLKIEAMMWNLFNRENYIRNGYLLAGRTFLVGFSIKF